MHNHHAQQAIQVLSKAFTPLECMIQAARNDCFSFTLIDEYGIACYSERVYPEQYSDEQKILEIIERARRKTLFA